MRKREGESGRKSANKYSSKHASSVPARQVFGLFAYGNQGTYTFFRTIPNALVLFVASCEDERRCCVYHDRKVKLT